MFSTSSASVEAHGRLAAVASSASPAEGGGSRLGREEADTGQSVPGRRRWTLDSQSRAGGGGHWTVSLGQGGGRHRTVSPGQGRCQPAGGVARGRGQCSVTVTVRSQWCGRKWAANALTCMGDKVGVLLAPAQGGSESTKDSCGSGCLWSGQCLSVG